MLFAFALNSVRLGRRATHPRPRCGTAYCRRSCALGLPRNVQCSQPWGSSGWKGQAAHGLASPAAQQAAALHPFSNLPRISPRIE